MLKLNSINVSFPSKMIFKDTSFIANPNEITVLIGESGSGKTTLFQTILLELDTTCEYQFYDEKINELNKKEKEEYLLNHVSYASQKPTFIADLKMMDQIELLKKIYNSDKDVSDLITLFELEKVLYSYPNQLSGGEKSRFAFILALLKDCDIYLFDEPTSALDDVQANHVIEILNGLKEEGKIIILSTHDHRLIEQGDCVYVIENQKLQIQKHGVSKNKGFNKEPVNIRLSSNIKNYWYKMKKHHKIYNIIMECLMALGIVLALTGIELGYIVRMKFSQNIEMNETNYLLVNKESYEDCFFNTELGLPLEKSDIEKIDGVKHIKKKYQYYSHSLIKRHSFINKNTLNTNEDIYFEIDFSVNLNGSSKKIEINFDTSSEDYGEILEGKFSTYPNEVSLSQFIMEDWNEEGLYISQTFYQEYIKPMIKNEEDKKEIRINFPLFVPMYNARGINHYGNYAQANAYAGIHEYVPLKIKGVLKGDYIFEEPREVSKMTFNLSNDEMQKYIDKYKVDESHNCFFHMEKETTICDEPIENYFTEEYKFEDYYSIDYVPYKPNTYIVEVDDIRNLNKVKSDLEELGFGVYNRYSEVNSYLTAENNMRNTILFVGCIAFVIILLTNIILKINNKAEEKSFQEFFKEKGFTRKMIRKLNMQRFIINCIEMTVFVLIEYIIANIIIYFVFRSFMLRDISEIIIIVILIGLTEFIVPMLLERYYAQDERRDIRC